MYATCLFCHAPLGSNDAVESFPVGRRLAFDAAKGRLWVVCRKCERWNLTPLEERWEAIEEAERAFRDTRLKVSTENVGMARLSEGLELVRIGRPERPEFAAWRYGDQFGRRRTRNLLIAGAGVATLGAVAAGWAAVGVGMSAAWYSLFRLGQSIVLGSPEAVVARVPTGIHHVEVRRKHLGELRLRPGDTEGSWRLRLFAKKEAFHLDGELALRAMALVLPAMNRFGGSRAQVSGAVQALEDAGGSHDFVDRAVARTLRSTSGSDDGFALTGLRAPDRLALEMALHEEDERRAMEGELAELERRWKEAEEIAGIADDLLLPDAVTETLKRARQP